MCVRHRYNVFWQKKNFSIKHFRHEIPYKLLGWAISAGGDLRTLKCSFQQLVILGYSDVCLCPLRSVTTNQISILAGLLLLQIQRSQTGEILHIAKSAV